MKILVTGANGLLGQHLINLLLDETNYHVVASGKGESRLPFVNDKLVYQQADLAEPFDVYDLFDKHKPDLVIHAGAITQVDYCEEHQQEAFNVNQDGTCSIIVKCEQQNCFLIFVSTDFVFNGQKGNYDENDACGNEFANWYGQTKWMAENLVQQSEVPWVIVRTCLVYGNVLSGNRSNIVSWVKDSLLQGKKIKVVADQWRTPTYVEDLAKGILLLLQKRASGIYHISGEEIMTPYDIAIATAKYLQLDESLIEKVDATVFTQTAKRPAKTGFNISKAKNELGYKPISFSEGLKKMLG